MNSHKKETPQPIPRAVSQGLAPRPLSPLRRYAIPGGLALGAALTAGGIALELAAPAPSCGRQGPGGDAMETPSHDRPHLAGEARVVTPPATVPSSLPTVTPTATPIPPERNLRPTAGIAPRVEPRQPIRFPEK